MSGIGETYRRGRDLVAEGLCLRRLDYGNTSQIISFLCPDTGRVECMFRGAWRAPGKGVSAGIDLLGRYRIVYRESGTGALDTLLECRMLEHFGALRPAVERALCGYYAVELMRNFTVRGESCRELYIDLVDILRRFAAGDRLGLGVLELETAVLTQYGSCPDFSRCATCMRDWSRADARLFSPRHCGVVCSECSAAPGALKNDNSLLPVDAPIVSLLDRIGNASGPVTESPAAIVSASKVLRRQISWLLDKELTMWKYLQERHYSRYVRGIRSEIDR